MEIHNNKKILFTVFSVLVAVLLLAYSAYAWITMGRTVSAKGVQLKATTTDNIEISTDTINWSDSIVVNLKDIVSNTVDTFNAATDDFYLIPASTLNAFNGNIWTTERAKTTGMAYGDTVFIPGQPISKKGSNDFSGNYIDVTLYFRSAFDVDKDIKLDEVKTVITGIDNENVAKVARLAFLSPGLDTNSQGGTVPYVYTKDIASNVTNEVVNASTAPNKTAPIYLSFSDGLSNATLFSLGGADYNQTPMTYAPYKEIVVRIWIEGQDSNCTVDVGQKSFNVNLGFTAAE